MADPKGKHVREAKALVTRKYMKGGEVIDSSEKEEVLEVRVFVVPPAEVALGLGLTLNLSNYESARVDVHLSEPCYTEEKDEAYDHAEKWVKERIQREVTEIRSHRSNSPF